MKKVTAYTDGACSGNPGAGGYGVVLVYNGKEKCLSGGEMHTTNNRMELLAVIAALEALKERCEVEIISDSKYVVDAMEKGWLAAWQKRGWRKADKSPVLNVDLWQRLLPLLSEHYVSFSWVKGHAGNPFNERCDAMAVEETKKHAEL